MYKFLLMVADYALAVIESFFPLVRPCSLAEQIHWRKEGKWVPAAIYYGLGSSDVLRLRSRLKSILTLDRRLVSWERKRRALVRIGFEMMRLGAISNFDEFVEVFSHNEVVV